MKTLKEIVVFFVWYILSLCLRTLTLITTNNSIVSIYALLNFSQSTR